MYHDLFEGDDGGWLEDPTLLDRLVSEKLQAAAEAIDVGLGELEVGMEKLEVQPLIFDAEEIGRQGAFVTLDRYVELAVYRGFVQPEDDPRVDVDLHSGE